MGKNLDLVQTVSQKIWRRNGPTDAIFSILAKTLDCKIGQKWYIFCTIQTVHGLNTVLYRQSMVQLAGLQ